MEVMTTTVARGERRSAGRKAWVTWSVPTTLLSNISRHSAGSPPSTWSVPSAPPALLTSTSQAPICAAAAATLAASVTSMTIPRAASTEVADDGVEALLTAAGDHDLEPVRDEPGRRGGADAGPAAGDDGDRAHRGHRRRGSWWREPEFDTVQSTNRVVMRGASTVAQGDDPVEVVRGGDLVGARVAGNDEDRQAERLDQGGVVGHRVLRRPRRARAPARRGGSPGASGSPGARTGTGSPPRSRTRPPA